ncbi:phage portal protein [Micromonospora sp. MED01]|uniref:phage portal protein n=1 Tax=Micromonospora alfalfae TaxID=2911212 RepID=UPI001EE81172|nr:phage portal protein [Micromonospora alfalfae]MCG5460839.1 phage portal protein [Micromonospora alfalfae]
MDMVTLPGISDDDHRTLNLLLKQLDAKRERNKLRQAYYDMKRVTRLVGSVIPPQYWGLGIVLGWSGKAVDVLSRRTNLDGFVWPDGKLDDIGFREVWEDNNLGSEVSQAGISSLIHSTAFVVNTRGGPDEPKALIHFRDALNATGEWNARTRRLDNLLSINARGDDDQVTALALYLDGRTIVAEKDASDWSVDVQEHPWGVPAEPLPYKPRLGRPFGSSRISREVMNLQDQAVRALIRLEAHSDIYAIPDLWLFGADESIFKNADGTTKAAWQVVMGRFKGVPDDDDAQNPRAEAKQFPASSPEPHLAALNAYAKMFARSTSLPDTAVAITDMANPTSAEAYDASQHELIAEAEGATDDWAPYLRRATIRALAMQNGISATAIPPEWKMIDTKWRDPRYLSRAAQADAGTKQLQAVPWLAETEVGLELLGLDEQQITRAWADRRRAQAQQRTTMLAAAAQAARQAPPAAEGAGGDAG